MLAHGRERCHGLGKFNLRPNKLQAILQLLESRIFHHASGARAWPETPVGGRVWSGEPGLSLVAVRRLERRLSSGLRFSRRIREMGSGLWAVGSVIRMKYESRSGLWAVGSVIRMKSWADQG